jgi:hypothetical protein
MRIHTDSLTEKDIYEATARAGSAVRVVVTEHGSRSRARAFNVTLSGTSSRRRNTGNYGAAGEDSYWGPDRSHAATWDEWGMFLAEIFRRDPNAVVPNAYESGEHFHWSTGDRFLYLTPPHQHGGSGHRWSGAYPNATGTYYVVECTSCEAIMRRMEYGHTFAEIAD